MSINITSNNITIYHRCLIDTAYSKYNTYYTHTTYLTKVYTSEIFQ